MIGGTTTAIIQMPHADVLIVPTDPHRLLSAERHESQGLPHWKLEAEGLGGPLCTAAVETRAMGGVEELAYRACFREPPLSGWYWPCGGIASAWWRVGPVLSAPNSVWRPHPFLAAW